MRSLKRRQTNLEEQRLKVYERILTDDEWRAVIQTLEEWPGQSEEEKREKVRLRLIVGLLFYLGLRVSDITDSTWQSFRKINDHWWFFVRGKGDKLAKIPVNNELLKIIIDYRIQFDMTV
jgi:integrase